MKAIIVPSSVLHREKTWAPKHYLGYEKDLQDDIVRKTETLSRAQHGLKQAHRALEDEKTRLQTLHASLEL